MKIMLDTNICIGLIRGRNVKQILKNLRRYSAQDVAISSITLAELEHGVEKSCHPIRNRKLLNNFLAPFVVPSFDEDAAREFGRIRAYLEERGKTIGIMDMLIASHALSLDVTLVTNNVREFKRVPKLRVVNWTAF